MPSTAGLFAFGMCTGVAPPKLPSTLSSGSSPFGSWPLIVFAGGSPQVRSLESVNFDDVIVPAQLPPAGLYARIVLVNTVGALPWIYSSPPLNALLSARVALRMMALPELKKPPPSVAVELPLSVEFVTVATLWSLENPPPPLPAILPLNV